MWKPDLSKIRWKKTNEARHVAKHGVAFVFAKRVFEDSRRTETSDLRKDYGEDRRNIVGKVDGICINVTFAVDREIVTIISARAASRKERKRYAENDAG